MVIRKRNGLIIRGKAQFSHRFYGVGGCVGCCVLAPLAGNVADMSRHVADDTPCRSNFGQMGPCRRHYFFDVVAVCVGLSRHFLDFLEFVCRNILWYGCTYAQILLHPHAKG